MSEPWYKSAIIYAIDVEKFADGNGDGIGDFTGLLQRLDYLAWLGVNCLWLLPFYPSPRRDNGYDVQDYFDVDARFGTLDDFARFVEAAGEHGIRIMIDLVLDHTSDRHPWFQAARRDRHSRYRDYYLWADLPPMTPPCPGPVFPGEESTVWTYDPVAGAYYYHRFYHFQPNLNLSNPEVRRQVDRIIDFWLSFGVAGFRLDAVPVMLGLDAPEVRKPRDPHYVLKDVRELVDGRSTSAALLGEADVEAEQVVRYFGDSDDELNMLFNFLLNNWLWLALADESKQPLLRVLQQLPLAPPSGQWVNFLRNLDELNLGWLDESDRRRVLEKLSPDPETQVYGRGARRRLAPLLDGDVRRLRLAFSLIFSLPGTPMVVYGDEIGMGDDLSLPGRDAVRSPMQWSDDSNAGFSSGPFERVMRPVVTGGRYGFERVNVEAQKADPDALLGTIRQFIQVRRERREFGLGTWHLFETGSDASMAHRCLYLDGIVLAVHNLSGTEQTCEIDIRDQAGRRLVDLLRDAPEIPIGVERLRFVLEPYGYRWYRVIGERIAGNRHCATAAEEG